MLSCAAQPIMHPTVATGMRRRPTPSRELSLAMRTQQCLASTFDPRPGVAAKAVMPEEQCMRPGKEKATYSCSTSLCMHRRAMGRVAALVVVLSTSIYCQQRAVPAMQGMLQELLQGMEPEDPTGG